MPQTIIRVKPNGQIEIVNKGYKGSSCQKIADIARKLGGAPYIDDPTPEFYETQTGSVYKKAEG